MATARRCITAHEAPPAIGPYSHAVRHADALYCSGPATNELVAGSLGEETAQCLRNGAFFTTSPLARVTVGVAALPKDARVEIDAIVAVG